MDFGMDDSYDIYYFLDVWDNTHMRYVQWGDPDFYDEIEQRFLAFERDYPETVTRIRKLEVATTNTVIRKSGGYYLHKQRERAA